MTNHFCLESSFTPMGDQPEAISQIANAIDSGARHQTLLGATGTGKTFTMANVIQKVRKPTLIISHNKTLAAQLFEEMKELFPQNAVSYFVSYYDYYQPEAYIPQRDIYIEKDAQRNDDLDRLRLAATSALVSRPDVIIVASVSCIFGLGSPDEYKKRVVSLNRGAEIDRRDLLKALTELQYERHTYELNRGGFRVRGDVVEIYPANEEYAVRVELFGDEIEQLALINPTSGELLAEESTVFLFPAVHYVTPEDQKAKALAGIKEELDHQVMKFRQQGKLLEAQRLLSRVKYDLELIEEVGTCNGIENYSRYFDGRPPGSKPYTLLDYFPDAQSGEYQGGYSDGSRTDMPEVANNEPLDGNKDFLLIIDESHVTLPQLRAMYEGDRQRKLTLVEHGFRLPSALDNRPLKFEEIEKLWPQVVFVSATPGPYELEKCEGEVAEQVIRPTGLLDPVIEVRPASGQVPDLLASVKERVENGERALVTTLTKRMSEDLAGYLKDAGISTRYLHSDIDTLDRITILRELREGKFDCLVGVNLLREGLDLPEVSFVAIMDADKAGFLRSPTSLIQTIGRAARNVNALVAMYGDEVSPAMRIAIDETERRREKQKAYNLEHNITPTTIKKAIRQGIELHLKAHQRAREAAGELEMVKEAQVDRLELIDELEKQMLDAAQQLQFEKAANLRDRVKQLKDAPDVLTVPVDAGETAEPAPGTPGVKKRRKGKKRG